MFNFRFNAIQEKTDRYWKFQNYQLVYEYEKEWAFPPPINLIFYSIYFYFYIKNNISEGSGNNFFLSKDSKLENSMTLEYAMELEREFAEELMIKLNEDRQKDRKNV